MNLKFLTTLAKKPKKGKETFFTPDLCLIKTRILRQQNEKKAE